jgi:hypothetical protein
VDQVAVGTRSDKLRSWKTRYLRVKNNKLWWSYDEHDLEGYSELMLDLTTRLVLYDYEVSCLFRYSKAVNQHDCLYTYSLCIRVR